MSVHFSPPTQDDSGIDPGLRVVHVMPDPGSSLARLLEDLEAEFMEMMKAGDQAAFDFTLENSDEANRALQSFGMGLMKTAGANLEAQPEGSRAPGLALWALCARQAFLDVVEKEVATLWAEQELPKRVCMFEEMREEHENPMEVMT